MTKAHTLSASQVAAFPNVLRSQETMDPMIPGRDAAALPAKLARARLRACRCFFIHSLTPPLSDGFGAGDGTGALSPTVSASTSVEIAMPIAVRIDAMVMPCSRKSVWIRFASVLSSWRSRLKVSRILLTWDCYWRAADRRAWHAFGTVGFCCLANRTVSAPSRTPY